MALPGHRRTSSHKRRRASHFALKKITLVDCPKCKQSKLQHNACENCGSYSGRQVLKLDSPLEKKAVKPVKKVVAKPAKATKKVTVDKKRK